MVDQAADGTLEISAAEQEDLDAVYSELRGMPGIRAQLEAAPVEPGEQGALADAMTVALTSGAVTAFLELLKVLAESRGPGFRLKIRNGRGRVEITARDADAGLAALKNLLDGS
jgi:hypothetical protein